MLIEPTVGEQTIALRGEPSISDKKLFFQRKKQLLARLTSEFSDRDGAKRHQCAPRHKMICRGEKFDHRENFKNTLRRLEQEETP